MRNNFLCFGTFTFRGLCFVGLGLAAMACAEANTESEVVIRAVPQEIAILESSAQTDALSVQTSKPAVRSADSHVHGGATLSIVSEAERVFVELETPLYNLLGFEYAPQTRDEKARVSDIETQLGQPQNLIVFNKEAKCTYNEINTQVSLFDTTPSNDAPLHGAENNHGHDHDHKNEHTHSEADEHDHSSGHKDIILSYSLTCDDLSKLRTVQVRFFEDFLNFTKLDLVYLGPSQQMSTELSPSKSKADLTR